MTTRRPAAEAEITIEPNSNRVVVQVACLVRADRVDAIEERPSPCA